MSFSDHSRVVLEYNEAFMPELFQALRRSNNPLTGVHFTNHTGVGMNPKPSHTDPLGVYAFPKDFVEELRLYRQSYFAKAKNMYVLEPTDKAKVLNLAMDESTLEDVLDDMGLTDYLQDPDVYHKSVYKSRLSYGHRLWGIIEKYINDNSLPKNSTWNTLFKRAGYNVLYDPGLSIIHSNEPSQIVYMEPGTYKVMEYKKDQNRYGHMIKDIIAGVSPNIERIYDVNGHSRKYKHSEENARPGENTPYHNQYRKYERSILMSLKGGGSLDLYTSSNEFRIRVYITGRQYISKDPQTIADNKKYFGGGKDDEYAKFQKTYTGNPMSEDSPDWTTQDIINDVNRFISVTEGEGEYVSSFASYYSKEFIPRIAEKYNLKYDKETPSTMTRKYVIPSKTVYEKRNLKTHLKFNMVAHIDHLSINFVSNYNDRMHNMYYHDVDTFSMNGLGPVINDGIDSLKDDEIQGYMTSTFKALLNYIDELEKDPTMKNQYGHEQKMDRMRNVAYFFAKRVFRIDLQELIHGS